jgi:hypothetical protein
VKAHFSDLSADCQAAITGAAVARRACKADVKQFCADAGKGAVAGCLQTHAADLSDGCKDAMAKAEAGAKQRRFHSTLGNLDRALPRASFRRVRALGFQSHGDH